MLLVGTERQVLGLLKNRYMKGARSESERYTQVFKQKSHQKGDIREGLVVMT